MPAQQILFVKLSSLGDVVHNLPAVTDLARHLPGARVAWAIEEAYAPLAAMHPAVAQVIPVGLRSLRAQPFMAERWRAITAARRALAAHRWDRVIDTQGLLKSALVASAARGRSFGLDRASAREPVAARFYDEVIAVPRELHAVERNRRLAGRAMGYEPAGGADYGLRAPAVAPSWIPAPRYAVLLHAASRPDKQWPEERWVELARRLAAAGDACVFPGGSLAERGTAARLAQQVPGAIAAPAMDLAAVAALLAGAARVVGVDTGLTHLAVALGRPTVGLYRATDPALTGLHGACGTNLGTRGREPSVDEVLAALGLA